MTEAAPSAVSSDITMESVDSLVHIPPEQLRTFVQHVNAVLGNPKETHAPDSVVLSHAPSATNASSAANNRPKISCETFTAQATKFSGEDLRMSAANWVEELYQYLLDAFPQADFELKVLQAINSGKLFKDAPKRALGTFAYAVYRNMDHNNPLAAFLITNSLYMMCKYFNRINTIDCGPEWTQQGNVSASNVKKKKKKRGNGSSPIYFVHSINCSKSKNSLGRETNHLISIPGLKAKDYKLKGLADTGAKVCLITERAAKRIGLNITMNSRPLLCALWPDAAPYRSVGRMHVHLYVDNGLQVWAHAIIISFGKGWDILVGGKTLQQLRIQLISPAMDRRLRGSTKVTDHPAKTLDGPWRQQTTVPSVEEAYNYMPDTAPSHDLAFPSLTETSGAVATVVEPVVAQPMRACLGLPADFFVPERDDDFHRLDVLYPEVTKVSVTERLYHQCETKTQADKLLGELMTGKGAVCEYPGGCPPPTAYAPIRPPMHAAAKPIYVVQHMLSEAACKACDDVVSVRLQYGINEPLQAFA
ncbi:hypothetical protein COEREDRAFT_12437 [Coemansia reversa NRRL 1564]|uniref:Uncharacterized protein n=1 Tax=Coemansia reversa (strain ATCC 12441 / NRRL 1564) TaxID=763665 RepID=A0A2G5B0W2_COERN|nr:hypothetical protein COEREDRAFT_12437 [Coemansia reversa NRRL 1564]|eukprot:PIA12653.1 hypothetical protein COEREDRAFT_12437 [Coemansia reversa NRRL 1564]